MAEFDDLVEKKRRKHSPAETQQRVSDGWRIYQRNFISSAEVSSLQISKPI